MPTYKQRLSAASEHLSHNDSVLATVIRRCGPAKLSPHTNYYYALVDSIISQQLSVKAASTIEARFRALFNEPFPEPASILTKSIDELRAVGLSNAKAHYIQDLAEHILDGRLIFDQLDKQSDEVIITKLIDIKGIGEWTAHMFLIFCMGRLDVLASGDLGIRNGIKKLYDLETLPTPQDIENRANAQGWHPYASVACWYIWASLENKPAI